MRHLLIAAASFAIVTVAALPLSAHVAYGQPAYPVKNIRVIVLDLPYDTVKDFAPVSMTHLTPYVFIVSAQSPVRALPELLKFIRGNA